ncbi:iron ABC transporter permease protein [methanogenic archaeon mixed culture ISO4-G1]|nr:iron ABC transporter permease protein [methanogenic archaeon mixed culture ISO4-G1]
MDDRRFIEVYRKVGRRKATIIAIVAVMAIAISLLEIPLGPYNIDFVWAYEVFFQHLMGNPIIGTDDYVVWEKSVPRLIAVLTAGSIMGVCGCAMQTTLKNPLADPYITGISSGANFGVALATIAGIFVIPTITGDLGMIINAFILSLVPAMAILSLSSLKKRASSTTMILIGIAVMYLFGACTTMLKLTASDETYAAVFSWALGTLGSTTWTTAPFLIVACIVSIFFFYILFSRLNLLSNNDELALTTGVSVKKVRLISICAVSLVTATVVCFTGTIGFVGLVAPHIMRIFMGSDCKYLVPVSAAAGALILAAADCIAIECTPTGLPVGVITAIIGGPIFIYILVKQHRRTWN